MRSARSRSREDWTKMGVSNWMDITPSDWMDRILSGWDRSYADLMNTSPADWWARLYSPAMSPFAVRTREFKPHHRHHHHDHHCRCGRHHDHHHDPCRSCGGYPCECVCCLGDVDLAINAHLGEQRLIPIVVENERRREKEVTLELSDWTTRGGKAAPVGTILLEPRRFTLPPCGEQAVILAVRVHGAGAERQLVEAAEAAAAEAVEAKEIPAEERKDPEDRVDRERIRLPDVDECLVAIADLRLVGCDHRPLRIAVAVLPRDCEQYRVPCGCTCC